MKNTKLVFGTYRIKGFVLRDSINQALHTFSENKYELLLDTASSYLNIDTINDVINDYPDIKIGWKIGKNKNDNLKKELIQGIEIFGNKIFRILLHNYYPSYNVEKYLHFQKIVENTVGKDIEIGVCNISSKQLNNLINSGCRINWVQNEFHPFLKSDVPEVCIKNNIKFEAHSCLVNLNEYPNYLNKLNQTPAQLAFAYASKKSYSICFNTINYSHLIENISYKQITDEYYNEMSKMINFRNIVRYNGSDGMFYYDIIERCLNDKEYLKNEIYPLLLNDIELYENNKLPSKLCVNIPKYRNKNKDVLVELAKLYYNKETDEMSICNKLDYKLKKMRKYINDDILKNKKNIKVASCPIKAITNPEALPVKFYPNKEKFNDLNNILKNLKEPPKTNIRFEFGTICSDGRYDMCKQGNRNAFIESSESMKTATGIKHYLFGNNKICEDDEDNIRLNTLIDLINNRPDIITWFLAGNCLDENNIEPISEALSNSQSKYIWLKMNPIKEGLYYLGKMIAKNDNIELLDIFNCGISNLALTKFVEGIELVLSENNIKYLKNFKHLYLTINILNIECSNDFNKLLSYMPNLESLYIGMNNWGDDGLLQIKDSIKKLNNLTRIEFGSSGLTDVSLPIIEEIIEVCPKLICVELGSYKSTNYFDLVHNQFTDINLLYNLASKLKMRNKEVYFGFKYTYSKNDINDLRNKLFELKVNTCSTQYCNISTYKNIFITKEQLKQLKHPPQLDYIESIYRNEMSTI